MRARAVVLAAAIVMAPLCARAADLVVWWEKGQAAEEDEAVREIVAAFEQGSGKQVELVLGPQEELVTDLVAALEAGRRTPDFVFTVADTQPYEQWAHEGRLVDLTDAVSHFSDLFDPDALERVTLLDGTAGRRALYLLPMGFATHHVHVWKNLLERSGFTLADVPTEWDAFWAFWCDQVQPSVRKALGRDDVWAVGLAMSPTSVDTSNGIWQFIDAYEADYVTHDGRLIIDDPEVRRRLIKAVDSYAAIYRKGCTPPDSVTWDGYGNNAQFLAQTIVMTLNQTLSVTNALKRERPEAPFWLDPRDPHRMRSAIQLLSQPRSYDYVAVSGDWRHDEASSAWPEAVHRVAAEGISPEQAVDEAIARIKQFLKK